MDWNTFRTYLFWKNKTTNFEFIFQKRNVFRDIWDLMNIVCDATDNLDEYKEWTINQWQNDPTKIRKSQGNRTFQSLLRNWGGYCSVAKNNVNLLILLSSLLLFYEEIIAFLFFTNDSMEYSLMCRLSRLEFQQRDRSRDPSSLNLQ